MYDPDKIFAELERAAEEMADTEALARQMEELRKAVLAEVMLGYLQDGSTSKAHAETLAYASEQYTTHVKGMAEAIRRATRAKARYHNLRALSEARRTQESSERALIARG